MVGGCGLAKLLVFGTALAVGASACGGGSGDEDQGTPQRTTRCPLAPPIPTLTDIDIDYGIDNGGALAGGAFLARDGGFVVKIGNNRFEIEEIPRSPGMYACHARTLLFPRQAADPDSFDCVLRFDQPPSIEAGSIAGSVAAGFPAGADPTLEPELCFEAEFMVPTYTTCEGQDWAPFLNNDPTCPPCMPPNQATCGAAPLSCNFASETETDIAICTDGVWMDFE